MKPRNHRLLDRNNSLLVLVDLQEPFLRNIDRSEQLVENCRLLISSASIMGIPILPTTQYAERMGGLIPEIESILPNSTIRPIDKLVFSAAGSQLFTDELLALGREQIILCGVETHICVLQTALDLAHLDYQVHCAVDAVSSRTFEKHKLGMEKMRDSGIIPCASEGAVMELLYEAGTADFKAILRLIK